MSYDYLLLGTYALAVLSTLVLLAGAGRAVQLGRGFVTRVYRRRAYWLAGLMISLAVAQGATYIPVSSTSVTPLESSIETVGGLAFLVALYIALVFVDQNILVTREVDFFHRDVLNWARVRKPAYVAMGVVTLIEAPFANINSGPLAGGVYYIAAEVLYYSVITVVLGWAAAALVVSARSTPDGTIRRFAKALGLALAVGVVASTIWIPISFFSLSGATFSSNLVGLASYLLLYLTVNRLSLLGHVYRPEALPPTTPGGQDTNIVTPVSTEKT